MWWIVKTSMKMSLTNLYCRGDLSRKKKPLTVEVSNEIFSLHFGAILMFVYLKGWRRPLCFYTYL